MLILLHIYDILCIKGNLHLKFPVLRLWDICLSFDLNFDVLWYRYVGKISESISTLDLVLWAILLIWFFFFFTFYKCYVVGYREQYSTIDGFILSNLWGIENKKIALWGTQKNRREQRCTPQINVYVCVCECVCACMACCVEGSLWSIHYQLLFNCLSLFLVCVCVCVSAGHYSLSRSVVIYVCVCACRIRMCAAFLIVEPTELAFNSSKSRE